MSYKSQRMKIGIIADPCGFLSGVKTVFDNVIENMIRMSDEIYLIHDGKVREPFFSQAKEIVLASFYRAEAPSAVLFDVHRPFLLRKYKLDIIHYTHNYPPFTFWASGSKNMCTVLGIAPIVHPQSHSFLSQYTARAGAFLGRHMDMILTDSEWAKTQIAEFYKLPGERIRVSYYGVDKEFKPQEKIDEAKSQLNLKYGIKYPYILQVNAYRPVKNTDTLIRAFARIKKLGITHKLVLVGKPTKKYSEASQLARNLGLGKEVVLLGYIPKGDLIKLYGTADLVVIPSFKESFCLPLVESLACGCPTIASNVTALPEVGGGAIMYFDPYSEEELASRMYEVLGNSELRTRMSKKGIERAKLFSWEKCAREHLAVYEEVYLGTKT